VGHFGVDVAFEVAGVNDAVEQAIAVTMPGGRVVLIGIPEGDRTSFRASAARRKGLTFMMARRMKEDAYPRTIQLVEQGRVDALSVVSHRLPLDRVEDAFVQASSRAGLKVVVQPGRSKAGIQGQRVVLEGVRTGPEKMGRSQP
jgi:L-iditol 2-dehydrogenase